MTVKIILAEGVSLPEYKTPGSAAVDLTANISSPIDLRPGQTVKIDTGVKLDMTGSGLCAIVLPRSGLGVKGLVLANTIGLIDQDYQGPITVAATNRNPGVERAGMGLVQRNEPIVIEPGMRLAQMMFVPMTQVSFDVVKSFDTKTERGEGGFGSTGTKGRTKAS